MTDFSAAELQRRLSGYHPTTRRQFAAMTDTTYRGPHNISEADDTPLRFLGFQWLVPVVPAVLAAMLWAMPA